MIGFGAKIQGTKKIADFFFNKGYDVFIPDYISRKSISNSVSHLDKFILKHNLKAYKNIHFFSYIIGSWTLHYFLQNLYKERFIIIYRNIILKYF